MPTLSRRRFAHLLTLSTTAALFPRSAFARDGLRLEDLGLTDAPLPRTPASPDEKLSTRRSM